MSEYTSTDTLDPQDPFDRVLLQMHALNLRKRADYALDGNPFSTFDGAAGRAPVTGVTGLHVCEILIAVKEERLATLVRNGRDPQNESVVDTLLDRAVYSVIAVAMARQYTEGTPG